VEKKALKNRYCGDHTKMTYLSWELDPHLETLFFQLFGSPMQAAT
jgi:hypothetical protein